MKRNNSGFTMVELLVTVAVSSIVLAAAASLMLLGLRVHQTTQKEAGEQQTVRIVLSALEDLSASGKIYRVEPLSDGWQLQGKTADGTPGAVLLRYNSGTLTSGTSGDQVLLDNLRGAQVILDGSLVTFTFATAAHSYSTSVFCRTGIEGDSVGKEDAQKKLEELKTPNLPDAANLTDAEKKARFAFLQTLAGQYDSRGEIKNADSTYTYKYFSEWYIDGYKDHPGWNQYTPWCACFLSWAADQKKASINGVPPSFADVDDGMNVFQAQKKWRDSGATPIPGDYVFFDWDRDSDPDHVGAVLCVDENGYLYTIEGNSGGRVALNCYPKNDPRIMGYGVLNWKTGEETTE
ncbi:MAG: CHAP domain-containing protein [Oscillibacter sp.]|nr:CHAP domain-containing protein [Oscillibacter sp.]